MTDRKPSETPPPADSPSGAELLGLGVAIAAGVVLPMLGGLWLDATAHTTPIGIVLGLLLGIVAAVGVVYVRFRSYWR